MVISKDFSFESAHYLPDYKGKCSCIHGHSYKLTISLSGDVDEKTGMIIDFGDISKIINEVVIDQLDHTFLNDIIYNPTAENLVNLIGNSLKKSFFIFGNIYRLEISLNETAKCKASETFSVRDKYTTYMGK